MRKSTTRTLLGVALAVFSLSTALADNTRYTVSTLYLPSGWSGANGIHLNNNGKVVGNSVISGTGRRAVIWDVAAGTATSLGTLDGSSYGVDINDSDQVAGYYLLASGKQRPFSWTSGGGMVNLMDGNNHADATGNATGISEGGTIIGQYAPGAAGNQMRGFTYSGGTLSTLTATGLTSIGSYPSGINQWGEIVGMYGGMAYQNFLITGGTAYSMGSLSGTQALPYGINVLGATVGVSNFSGNGSAHAFYWVPDVLFGTSGTMRDLGVLGTGNYSIAFAVSDYSVIVGYSEITPDGAYHAFKYCPCCKQMTDLNSLLATGHTGWLLIQAHDVNNKGQILCLGYNSSTGYYGSVLLNPQ